MTWSDVQQSLADFWSTVAAHPFLTAAVVAGVLVLAAFYTAFDVVVAQQGISVTFIRWPIYTIPFERIARVDPDPEPLTWGVNLFGFRFGNSPFDSGKWNLVFSFRSDPFAKRVYIETTDRSLFILGPSDREKFLRDLQAHRKPDSVAYPKEEEAAEAVIMKRIAQERVDRAEHEER